MIPYLEKIIPFFLSIFLNQAFALPSHASNDPQPRRIPTHPGPDIEKVSLPGYNSQVAPHDSTGSEEVSPENPSWTFNQTCSQLTLGGRGKKGQTALVGVCRDQNGVWWDTSLNLNLCFGNDGGLLSYKDSGNFDKECRPCIISDDGTPEKGLLLKCNCLNPDRMPQYTSIGMGPGIDHPLTVKPVAGRLMCGDQLGNKSPNFGSS